MPPSGIQKFLEIINSMPDVLSLGVGEPDFVTPMHIREAAYQACAGGPDQVLAQRRPAWSFASCSRRTWSGSTACATIPVTEICIAVGVSEALQDALIATLEPGDEVIVPEPCFMAYQPNVIFARRRAGGRPHLLRARLRGDGRGHRGPPDPAHPRASC